MELTVQEQIQKNFDTAREDHKKAVVDLKAAVMAEIEQKTKNGFSDPEAKEKIDRYFAKVDELDAKLSNPGGNAYNDRAEKSMGEAFTESAEFKGWQERGCRKSEKMIWEAKKSFFKHLEFKTPIGIGNVGAATSGVQNFIRLPELIQLQRQRLTIRDLMRTRELTTGNSVDWVKQNVATRNASPQTEASAKAESTITYTTATSNARTIAHFMQVTRQALDDIAWLRGDIDSELMFGLKLKEETEILSGDGLGDHISGLTTQATAYASGTYNVGTDTKLDKLRHYILQSRLALYPVDGIVMNPRDLHDIELLKTEEGGANKGVYIVGNPAQGTAVTFIWGKPVIESDSIAYGKALVGAFGLGAILFDRMQATIDISFEHSTNFTTNQATILAEERLALACVRPASFIYGSI